MKRTRIRIKVGLITGISLRKALFVTIACLALILPSLFLFFSHAPQKSKAENLDSTTPVLELGFNPQFAELPAGDELIPILFTYTHPDLRSISQGGKIEDPNASDIAFYSPDGQVLLAEIERYEPLTGKITAWLHINKDILVQKKIQLRFGMIDSAHVRGFGYPHFAVLHLNRDFRSSAAFPLAGEYKMIKDEEGKIAGGKSFNASQNASIIFDRPIGFPKKGNIQVSAWIKPLVNDATQYLFTDYNNKGGCSLFLNKKSELVFELYDGKRRQSINSGVRFQAEQWYRITAGYDAEKNELYIYQNNRLIVSQSANFKYTEGGRIVVGSNPERDQAFFTGIIDELRISSLNNNPDIIHIQTLSEDTPELIFSDESLIPEQQPDVANLKNTISVKQVLPNPFSKNFSVTFDADTKESIEVSLTSISGKVVYKSALHPDANGEQVFNYSDQGNLSPGIYFLNLKQSAHQRTMRLIKKG